MFSCILSSIQKLTYLNFWWKPIMLFSAFLMIKKILNDHISLVLESQNFKSLKDQAIHNDSHSKAKWMRFTPLVKHTSLQTAHACPTFPRGPEWFVICSRCANSDSLPNEFICYRHRKMQENVCTVTNNELFLSTWRLKFSWIKNPNIISRNTEFFCYYSTGMH